MEHFGHKFKRIDTMFKMRMDKNLENLDLTLSQMHVLIYLDMHSGEKVTQKILANEFNVKHSTMAGILQRMKEKGLIEITVDSDNKKYKNIVTTAKADLIREETKKQKEETEAVLLKGFSKEETDILYEFLERVYKNLEDDCESTDKKCDMKGDGQNA